MHLNFQKVKKSAKVPFLREQQEEWGRDECWFSRDFWEIKDSQVDGTKPHKLEDIIDLSIIAIMAGAQNF